MANRPFLLPFDPDLTQALRQAGRRAGQWPVTFDDLHRILLSPVGQPLPSTEVRVTSEVKHTLEQASLVAMVAGATAITRTHVQQAVLEITALQAGLDLNRLRFTRWRIQHSRGHGLSQRRVLAG